MRTTHNKMTDLFSLPIVQIDLEAVSVTSGSEASGAVDYPWISVSTPNFTHKNLS